MSETHYHIIGGGIAGLTAAKYLKKYDAKAKVFLYEAAGKPGGRCFSYQDKILNAKLDNATHAVLKANTEAQKLLGKVKFNLSTLFYDLKTKEFSSGILRHKKEIAQALFNLPLEDVDKKIVKTVFKKMFPFINARKVYFSNNHLSEYLINPQIQYIDEVHYNYVLKDIRGRDNQATKLVFNKETIALDENDRVICAIDVHNFSRIFKTKEPQYSPIINIHYRTSTPITLPNLRTYIGVSGGMAQWILVNGEIISATISNASGIKFSDEGLAREVWKEICQIRGVEAAFVPPFRVLRHKRATIRQDAANNSIRPDNCQTQYQNFFIAGDWTMKNWPCSIEAAAQSGKRAAKAAVKPFKKTV